MSNLIVFPINELLAWEDLKFFFSMLLNDFFIRISGRFDALGSEGVSAIFEGFVPVSCLRMTAYRADFSFTILIVINLCISYIILSAGSFAIHSNAHCNLRYDTFSLYIRFFSVFSFLNF